jgi:spermidine synthase
MQKRPLYFEIFTTALGSLLLEISYTRIFSFKVFYYFTYLILGIGLLGIGAGGIAIATSERLRRVQPERLISGSAFAGGASVLAGYLLISPLQLNLADKLDSPVEILKLLLVMLLLTLPFFAVGLIISSILSARPEASSKLYGADLLGAALGCVLAVPLIYWITPPRTVILAGLALAVAGLPLARGSKRLLSAGALTALVLAGFVVVPNSLADPVVAKKKVYEEFRDGGLLRFSKWNPVFRVDVFEHPFFPGNKWVLFHDGQPGSGMRRFNGDFSEFDHLDTDSRALPFEVLAKEPRVLIIGAAGGHEIVSSLYFKASHVTGVELNPVTYSLLTDVFADATGNLAKNPKVTHINGDGRWFLKQDKQEYDLIWFVAPDSYAAMNAATAGAFVLSESYLYTVEMIRQSLSHLSEHGIICTQFGELFYATKPNRTSRYLATSRAAFKDHGIPDFSQHVMVATATGLGPFQESIVLLSKQKFGAEQIAALRERTAKVKGGEVRYVPGMQMDASRVTQAILMPEEQLDKWFDEQPYELTPIRDDAPFFWHFARFRDAITAPLPLEGIIDFEDSIAEQVTLAFFIVVTILAAVFLLLPLWTIRGVWKALPYKGNTLVYFAALGLGFMFLEVAMIQKLTLLLGYPTYALSVTLFALLLASGAGSLISSRYGERKNRALFTLLGLLAVVVVGGQVALPGLIDAFVGSALPLRIAVAVIILAPVGLCLGAFMPLGLRSIARSTPHAREYVAWAWAVNGFCSVIASILSTILAMVIGFKWLMLLALGIYVVGVLALARLPQNAASRAPARSEDTAGEGNAVSA